MIGSVSHHFFHSFQMPHCLGKTNRVLKRKVFFPAIFFKNCDLWFTKLHSTVSMAKFCEKTCILIDLNILNFAY